jgi:hypothetical protein
VAVATRELSALCGLRPDIAKAPAPAPLASNRGDALR